MKLLPVWLSKKFESKPTKIKIIPKYLNGNVIHSLEKRNDCPMNMRRI